MIQVSKEKAIADQEEEKVAVFALEVGEKQRSCEEDLAKAEPALIAAQEALNTLNKVDIMSIFNVLRFAATFFVIFSW